MPKGNFMSKFYCDNCVIRDEYGRERIFRGINACIKSHHLNPKVIDKAFDDDYFDGIKKIGTNIIRLGITWALVEPEENKYNIKVIEAYKRFVKRCEDEGIYVVLDMHQDLFSHKFFGDGAPEWVIDKSLKGEKYLAIWAEGYFYMNSVQRAFNDFWTNKNGIQDKFVRMWKFFSNEFKDCKNVIGLDYLNEPYVHKNGRAIFLSILENTIKIVYGKDIRLERFYKKNDRIGFLRMALRLAGVIKTPKRVEKLLETMDNYDNFKKATSGLEKYTQEFNEKYYQSFFDRLCKEASLDGRFNLFEHNYYSNLGIEFEISTKKNDVYSPHAYDIFIDSALYDKYSSNERIKVIIDGITENQKKMQVPVIFGEWGGSAPSGDNWIKHIEYVSSLLEERHWSSMYWAFNYKKEKHVNALNTPYPIAVCGDIIEMKTDRASRKFTLKWTQNTDFDENVKTEVYVPDRNIVKFDSHKGLNEITIEY